MSVIETERLRLRPPQARDRAPYAAMMVDPLVYRTLAGPQTAEEADAALTRAESRHESLGFGLWAAELKATDEFVGLIGLQPLDSALGLGDGVEMAWRLASPFQGRGLASEGATAALAFGRGHAGVGRILAFTARSNLKSQAVMRRIGLHARPDLDFDHPNLSPDHPLRPHVVFIDPLSA